MRFMGKWIFALWAAVAMGMLPACSSTVERVTDTKTLGQFAFLQPGITTDAEVRARFGKPYAVYEDGRVVTYHLEFLGGQYRVSANPSGYFVHLVLVYTADGMLEQWSLVRERGL